MNRSARQAVAQSYPNRRYLKGACIDKRDDTLAHGVVRTMLQHFDWRQRRLVALHGKAPVELKQLLNWCGDTVVGADITRAVGKRQRWMVGFISVCHDGAVPVSLCAEVALREGRVFEMVRAVEFTAHACARILQRIVGKSDQAALLTKLKILTNAILSAKAIQDQIRGGNTKLVTECGTVCLGLDEGVIVVKTFYVEGTALTGGANLGRSAASQVSSAVPHPIKDEAPSYEVCHG